MASKQAETSAMTFDDLETADPETDDDAEFIDFDPGQTEFGEVRELSRGLGEHNSTLLRVSRGPGDEFKMWASGHVDRQLQQLDVDTGDVIGLRMSEEESTFVDEDGEEQSYHRIEVGVRS